LRHAGEEDSRPAAISPRSMVGAALAAGGAARAVYLSEGFFIAALSFSFPESLLFLSTPAGVSIKLRFTNPSPHARRCALKKTLFPGEKLRAAMKKRDCPLEKAIHEWL
jgi:hypothetical protein